MFSLYKSLSGAGPFLAPGAKFENFSRGPLGGGQSTRPCGFRQDF